MATTKLMKQNGEKTTDVFKNVSSMFDDLFQSGWLSREMIGSVPAVNISEDNDNYYVEMSAPGYHKDDVKVEMDENMLIVSAERKKEETEEDKTFTRKEFSYGSFKRSLYLPDTVKEDEIHAKYEDGILKLTLPKKEESKPKPPRKIDID
jgi:HSP20 family protein